LKRPFSNSSSRWERQTLLADTDGLTGLCNHRHFLSSPRANSRLQYGISIRSLSSCLIWIILNRSTIRLAYRRDKLLVEVAQIAASQVRASDLVARYGGDEFIVLLPYASTQQALAVAERIRAGVAAIFVDAAFRDDKDRSPPH